MIADRIKGPLLQFIRSAFQRIDYYAFYRARVTSQSTDKLKLDVLPDDDRLPPMAGIPVRHGLPGITVEITTGYVLVGFMGGDPSLPYVHCWEGGESPDKIHIAGDIPAARKGDGVGHGTLVFTFGAGSGAATLAVVYTPGDGSPVQTLATGSGTLTLKEKITEGSSIVELG